MSDRTFATSSSDLEGKTIDHIYEGYEDTRIVCEDGTTYSIHTRRGGNSRDI